MPTSRADSDDLLRLLFETAADYAMILLTPEGVIEAWNIGAQKLFGYTESDVVGRKFSLLFLEEDVQAGVPQAELTAASETGRASDVRWHARKDGSKFFADGGTTALRNSEGTLLGFAKLARDGTDKKLADDSLASSEERLRLMLQGVKNYAIFMLDTQGNVTSWNEGAERVSGYSGQEILGKPLSIFFPPEDAAARIPELVLDAAFREGRHEVVAERVRKDGSRFWAEAVLTPVRSPDGDLIGFVKVLRDITARKAVEERLALQSGVTDVLAYAEDLDSAFSQILERLGTVLGASLANYWTVDPEADELRLQASWRPNGSSSALAEPATFRPGEGMPGRTWQSGRAVWIEDLLSESPTAFRRLEAARKEGFRAAAAFPVILRGQPFGVIEFFYQRCVPADAELVKVLNLVGYQIGHFIEKRKAEVLLRESEGKYRAIAEAASDAIFTIDAKSTIHYVNAAVKNVFGFEPDELIGRTLDVLIPLRLRDAHHHGLHRYAKTGKKNIPWSGVALPGTHKDGREIALELSFGEFAEAGQHRFTGFARDVTDRRRAEQERAELLAREQEARRHAEEIGRQNAELYESAQRANRAKDDFLATISHELRTPMTSILGWVRLLKLEEDPAVISEALVSIERSAAAQAQLIEDILDMARIREGKLHFNETMVDLAEVIEHALEVVKVRLQEKNLHLDMELDRSVPHVLGDPQRLQQVIWNLLSNAVKFTPAGETIEVRLLRNDETAVITVCDTGPGIPPDFLPHLFERFSQADDTRGRSLGGLGLGLSIARHLVELHGGTISASSRGEGKGATFTVELPLSAK